MSDYLDVHGFADGELTPEEIQAFRAKLECDPQVKAEYESVLAIKATLTRTCSGVENPELWNACQSRLKAIDQTKRIENFVSRWQYAFAGMVLAVIVGMGIMQRNGSSQRGVDAGELPTMISSLSPVPAGQSNVQNWIGRQGVDSSIQISLDSFQIQRMFESDNANERFARIDLADKYGPFTLLIFPKRNCIQGMGKGTTGEYEQGTLMNLPCVAWSDRGNSFILFGRRDPLQLEALANRLRTGQ